VYIDNENPLKRTVGNNLNESSKQTILEEEKESIMVSEEGVREKNYIKNTLMNLKYKKYSTNLPRNNIIVKTTKENVSMYMPIVRKCTAEEYCKEMVENEGEGRGCEEQ
jgi:hypothetical protein